MKGSCLLMAVVCGVPAGSLGAADLFSDDFDRPDGPLDADPEDDWITPIGTADIVDGEVLLQTAGTEGWTWIDSVSFSGDVSFAFDLTFDAADSTPEVGRHGGVMFFANEKTERYSPTMKGYTFDWIDRGTDHGYRVFKWQNNVPTLLQPDLSAAEDPDPGRAWRVTIVGPTMTLEVDGVLKLTAEDEEYREGSFGFWGWSNGQHMHIDNVQAQEPPSAKIVATPESGPAPLQVSFDGSGSTTPEGTIAAYSWDFGDGGTAAGAKVQHTYAAPGAFTVRLAVTDSRGISSYATATVKVSFASGDVSPWRSSDVGSPVLAGGARLDGDCLSVFASGKEIRGTQDHFHFVHQEKAGDVTIATQLKEAVVWQVGARAGVMLRDSLDPDSAFALMAAQPTVAGVRTIFLSRTRKGATATQKTTPSLTVEPPGTYLRLERKGAELIGSASTDGAAWSEIARATLEAPAASMLAGLAVTSGDRLEQGVFANVLFCGTAFGELEPPPNAPRNLVATPGDGQVALAWDAPDPGPPFEGYAVYRDGAKAAEVGLDPRSYTDGGRTNGREYCYEVRAVRGGAVSAASNKACATPQAGGAPVFHRGDADDNGQLQLTDAVRVLGYLFLGGPEPACLDSGDADDNGQLQLTDAVKILGFLFLGQPPPEPPGPPGSPCGPDPAGGVSLGCGTYTSCQ